MRSLLPLTVYCISLVSLQQLLALPAEERPGRNSIHSGDGLTFSGLSHTVLYKHSSDSLVRRCRLKLL
ncbi:hypothetical protein PAMP_014789 [Pampus punctatissimus]